MANVAVSFVVVVLAAISGLPSKGIPAVQKISEQNVRSASARQYSEILRVACSHGLKFRHPDVVAGFHRHFSELRLILLDRDTKIIPLAYRPELEVFNDFFGLVVPPIRSDRRGCFRGRWRKPIQAAPLIISKATPAERQ